MSAFHRGNFFACLDDKASMLAATGAYQRREAGSTAAKINAFYDKRVAFVGEKQYLDGPRSTSTSNGKEAGTRGWVGGRDF